MVGQLISIYLTLSFLPLTLLFCCVNLFWGYSHTRFSIPASSSCWSRTPFCSELLSVGLCPSNTRREFSNPRPSATTPLCAPRSQLQQPRTLATRCAPRHASAMQILLAHLLGVTILTSWTARALLVTPSSQCAASCGNTLAETNGTDLVCADADYGSLNGVVFQSCVECELNSTAVEGSNSDLRSLLCE